MVEYLLDQIHINFSNHFVTLARDRVLIIKAGPTKLYISNFISTII